jgi:hypothetical protein
MLNYIPWGAMYLMTFFDGIAVKDRISFFDVMQVFVLFQVLFSDETA